MSGECMAALTDLPLWERPFGGVRARFCDGLGFEKKPKSVLQLIFLEGFLCFEKIVGMKLFAELFRWRSGVGEGCPQGDCKNTDESRKLSCGPLHVMEKRAIAVPELNLL